MATMTIRTLLVSGSVLLLSALGWLLLKSDDGPRAIQPSPDTGSELGGLPPSAAPSRDEIPSRSEVSGSGQRQGGLDLNGDTLQVELPKSSLTEPEPPFPGWLPTNPSPEDVRMMKVRVLKSALQDFRSPSKEVAHTAPMLLSQSIAHLMDAAGTWRPSPEGSAVLPNPDKVNYFQYNDRCYEFNKGAFPEFDRLMDWMRQMDSYNGRRHGSREPLTPPPFAPEVRDWIEVRAQEALAVLGDSDSRR